MDIQPCGPVLEETGAQSGDWHGSDTLHPGQFAIAFPRV
jgi:hypothetical protein